MRIKVCIVLIVFMSGCILKSQRSQGVLLANVGMTFAQVKADSTVSVNPHYYKFTHPWQAISEVVFDYEIPRTGMRFKTCR